MEIPNSPVAHIMPIKYVKRNIFLDNCLVFVFELVKILFNYMVNIVY